MYWHHNPNVLTALFPQFLWRKNKGEKRIYLTFDDGPQEEATPWVLDCLADFNAKATFFCVGENVQQKPKLMQRLMLEEHGIGNHTHNHLNGWKQDTETYSRNVQTCQKEVEPYGAGKLFRPPYGKLKWSQAKALKNQYTIVLWDVLSGDFDPRLAPSLCLQKCLKYATDGSILNFHDSHKSIATLKEVLPKLLRHFSDRGHSFQVL